MQRLVNVVLLSRHFQVPKVGVKELSVDESKDEDVDVDGEESAVVEDEPCKDELEKHADNA